MIRTFAAATLAAFAFLAVAGIAEARERTFVAQLAQPVAERVQVVADGAIWTCEGDVCRARVDGSASLSGCRVLVREVGVLNSYGSETNPMSEARLASCNNAAATAATQSADARD